MDVNRLGQINVANLTNICKRHMQLSYLDCRSRASIYSVISGQQIIVQEAINWEASNDIQSGLTKYAWKSKESESGQGPSNDIHHENGLPNAWTCIVGHGGERLTLMERL